MHNEFHRIIQIEFWMNVRIVHVGLHQCFSSSARNKMKSNQLDKVTHEKKELEKLESAIHTAAHTRMWHLLRLAGIWFQMRTGTSLTICSQLIVLTSVYSNFWTGHLPSKLEGRKKTRINLFDNLHLLLYSNYLSLTTLSKPSKCIAFDLSIALLHNCLID